ncbi:MAG: hypothetical protein HY079_10490 [Elusimicrobia bacterium]|nr:hypothetical protein [Elusimicrobiota bacterium]
MTNNLFVGGFPYETTEDALMQLFASCGTVLKVKILTDGETGRSRGIGFVLMQTEAQAAAAIAKLNGAEFGSRKIFVTEAKPPTKPVQRSLGGYADKPGFVERRSGKDRRQNPPPFAPAPAAPAAAEKPWERRAAPGEAKPWERKPGGFGGPKKWEKKPGAPGEKKWEKKSWDRKPGGADGPKKWDKKPGGFGGPRKFGKKPGGYPKGPR